MQNPYSVGARSSAPVLAECIRHGIPFVPWAPLGSRGTLDARPIRRVAARHGVTAAQVALAWLLAQGPNVLLIPGTASRAHLAENLAAGQLTLIGPDLAELDTVPTGS